MLGPELVNHVIKPTPLFSTGTPSLQLSHPVPRELGLSNYQTINALIQSNSAGLLYLKMNNRRLELPEHYRKLDNRVIQLQVRETADGIILIPGRVLPKALTPLPAVNLHPDSVGPVSGRSRQLLQNLNLGFKDIASFVPPDLASRLSGWIRASSLSFPPLLSGIDIKNIIANSGLTKFESNYLTIALLIDLLRSSMPAGPERKLIEEFFGDLLLRSESAARAMQRGDVYLECAGLINQTPFDLVMSRRESKGSGDGDDEDSPRWQVDLYTYFSDDDQVWLTVQALSPVKLDVAIWMTSAAYFALAKEALRDLRVELEDSGIDVASLELYNLQKGSVPNIRSPTSSSSISNIDLQV
jgi:hypothetical protein